MLLALCNGRAGVLGLGSVMTVSHGEDTVGERGALVGPVVFCALLVGLWFADTQGCSSLTQVKSAVVTGGDGLLDAKI